MGVDHDSVGVDHNSVGLTIITWESTIIAWGLTRVESSLGGFLVLGVISVINFNIPL